MKIGHLENKAAASTTATERKSSGTSGSSSTTKGSSAEPSAKVELSASAALGSEATDPVFDTEKVKRISDAIRDGKFEVNAEAVADKLIANAQELLSPKSSS